MQYLRKRSAAGFLIGLLMLTSNSVMSQRKQAQEYYQIKIYQLDRDAQEPLVDAFLKDAFLPALHRSGIASVGVFKPVANDTAQVKKIYVIIPLKTLQQAEKIAYSWMDDPAVKAAAGAYLNAPYDVPAFVRVESILLKAFPLAPQMKKPHLASPRSENIYELRSYESPSEALHLNKVKMFNQGGEIDIFKRLDFNAVFYASVISGPRMPNLMYMTSFNNRQARDEHWKAFGSDPAWKKLSAMPEYQHNVSKSDIIFLHPAPYSDF